MMEGCALSPMQGQGCTIIQPAGDGLRVNCLFYCSALSLMSECAIAFSFRKILFTGNSFLLGHGIINTG